jgi:hypothetical protein
MIIDEIMVVQKQPLTGYMYAETRPNPRNYLYSSSAVAVMTTAVMSRGKLLIRAVMFGQHPNRKNVRFGILNFSTTAVLLYCKRGWEDVRYFVSKTSITKIFGPSFLASSTASSFMPILVYFDSSQQQQR